jgi:signal transduction histidine kinase
VLLMDVFGILGVGYFAVVGLYDGPIGYVLPGLYVLIGTIICAVRGRRPAVLHLTAIGLGYAAVLRYGPPGPAAVGRWVAVMAAVVTTGVFCHWLLGTVAGRAWVENQAREDVEAATRDLQRISAAKSAFLARMSHELRTPLNAVLGFAELLSEQRVESLNPRQAEYVADIAASGRHLVALVDDVLDLAKVETGDIELDIQALDVRDAIEDAVRMVREQAASAGVRLELGLESGIGAVEADGRKIRQVLVNLLANAVKFTPRGGLVRASVRTVGDRVDITVSDTGVGIAPIDIPRIFEEFAQTTSAAQGTGLGLPLARRFVEAHGGRLRVSSSLGSGSSFVFDLPLRRSGELPDDSALPEIAPLVDHSAFTEPGSAANRALVGRIGSWLAVVGSVIGYVVALVTPMPASVRVVTVGVASLGAVVAYFVRRELTTVPRVGLELFGVLGICAVSVVVYFGGVYTTLVPLAYAWVTMTTFALWPRRRAVAQLGLVAVSYAVVLILLGGPGQFSRWLTLMVVLSFIAQMVSGLADQLRQLVVSEQAARYRAEQVRAQLLTTSRHKSAFLANMSHELRTPLNAVIGFSDLLHGEAVGTLTARQKEYVDDIRIAARHLLAIINDVLDLAKLEAGQMSINPGIVVMADVVAQALASIQSEAASRLIRLEASIAPEVELVVADEHRLGQVLTNLISNAVKFTDDGGEVSVAISWVDDGVRIQVRDTGIGIVDDQRDRIFEAFHQGTHVLANRVPEGAGLGLALARSLVQLHGGRISADSQPGAGSTFTVHLPQPRGAELLTAGDRQEVSTSGER